MRIHPAAWSLFLLLGAGIVAAGFYAVQPREDRAPDLVVPTLGNETFDLAAERGNVVVLDFFNVYCESCVLVEREIKSVLPEWDPARVRVVSVGSGIPNDAETLRAYALEHDLNWTVAQDTDDAMDRFGIIAFPTVVVVDPEGHVVLHRAGITTAGQLREVVAQALLVEADPVPFARYSLWLLPVAAAVASFFSPCAVGLLPGYVGHAVRFHADAAGARVRRAATLGLIAASGLLLVFLGVGGLAFAFGRSLAPYVPWLGPLVGFVFILVGILLLARPFSLFLQRVFSPLTSMSAEAAGPGSGRLGYFLYGIGYGAGSAGCTAPVLLGLVGLAAQAGPRTGLLMVGAWAATAAVFMAALTVAVAVGRRGFADAIRRHAKKVEVASALLFVGVGVFLLWFAWRAGTLAA